jgi:catechol 2,3-dioxygenase-like lactoylglutathione lyase family enzyme
LAPILQLQLHHPDPAKNQRNFMLKTEPETDKARAVGINHVAIEVHDIVESLEFLAKLFKFKIRSQSTTHAFIELGDQFIALFETDAMNRDSYRHFGFVVDDKSKVRARLKDLHIPIIGDRFLDFRDPSGNRWQIVDYTSVDYHKRDYYLHQLGLGDLTRRLT